MNEVTKIHLGRQAYTIAADAHNELKKYLAEITGQVGDKEVVGEVELRMAELLAERGITAEKVILSADVDYLKEQLGSPKDFKDEDEVTSMEIADPAGRRLFRDTNNAMIAGVASGLAGYFGVDVLLIRILFVVGTIAWGGGILIYIALWLLVPPARTSSERLQMQGKRVTIDSLKEVVERADVKGAAHRVNDSLAGPVNSFFTLVMKVIGLGLVVAGLAALLAVLAAETYVLLHSGNLFGQDIFPVGFREHLLLSVGLLVAAVLAGFVILFGVAFFKQRWPLRTWLTGTLIGLLLISLAAGSALAADAVPKARARYNAHIHTAVRTLPAFTDIKMLGDGVELRVNDSSNYSATLEYFDNPDVSKIKTSVSNGTLLIDSRTFNWKRNCSDLCIPPTYNVVLTVNAPNLPRVEAPMGKEVIFPGYPPYGQ